MHELSVALGIIEGVEEELVHREAALVTAVYLRLGPLSGVSKEALLFAYEVACEGSALAGSRLEIEEVPIMLYCSTCEREQPAASIQLLCCKTCGAPSADVRQGSELQVFAMELNHEHAAASG